MITIKSIANTFKKMYENTVRKPAQTISGIVLACSLAKRPGLSTIISVSNILSKLAKYGIPTENLPDGTPNKMNVMIYLIVDEIYRALREDASIQIAVTPTSIKMSSGNMYGTNVGYNILRALMV